MSSQQRPIGSPFTASSTVDDVLQGVDIRGRNVIVTGGYSGIGLEAVRALVAAGASVTVPTRDVEKATQALASVEGVQIETMNLLEPWSIETFAERYIERNGTLDILINSAGVMANPLTRDDRGYESQFSTNVLGHFQLTCALWPALRAAPSARVVAVTSNNHHADVAALLHDPNFKLTEYNAWSAYARSKAANILFAVALDSIGKHHGVRAFAAHPGGIIETGLARHMDMAIAKAHGMIDDDGKAIIDPDKGWKNAVQGASTMVWGATSALLEGMGGVYLTNSEVGELKEVAEGELSLTGVIPSVVDSVSAGRLWGLCEALTGARLD